MSCYISNSHSFIFSDFCTMPIYCSLRDNLLSPKAHFSLTSASSLFTTKDLNENATVQGLQHQLKYTTIKLTEDQANCLKAYKQEQKKEMVKCLTQP